MSESKHAAIPWRISGTGYSIKSDAADMPIVATNPWGSAMREADAPAWLANAEFVVRAVNSYEATLNALREVADELSERADVSDGEDGPRANWAMSLLQTVERAIQEAEGKR